MNELHGIIFAYNSAPELRELVQSRTAASLPFCGRYRLIDFALSSLRCAGVRDVGVVMQRDYQSLLDHLGNGKPWDLTRREGGLRILPPFGLPEYHRGDYGGTMEALNAVSEYVRDIQQDYVALILGNTCANIDFSAALQQHLRSGADMTAICTDRPTPGTRHKFITGEDGFVTEALYDAPEDAEGYNTLEAYILPKKNLIRMMNECMLRGMHQFHRDAIAGFLRDKGKIDVYLHKGYSAIVTSVDIYYKTSMDMLDTAKRHDLFDPARPVRTKTQEGVSTYYGEKSASVNSLVGDNCIIEGSIENCIVFSGVRIEAGAQLKDCIIMRGSVIGKDTELKYVITDKSVTVSDGVSLTGSPKLPIVVPKNAKI